MPRRREPRPAPALELKTTRLAGIQIILNSAEHAALETHISTLFAATPDFFGGEAAVFECGRLPADAPSPDWAWLARELKSRGLNPFAVQNASPELAAAAVQAGLLVLNAAAPAPTAPPTTAITDIVWQWTSVANKTTNEPTTVTTPEKYTITFRADGTLSGKADCNNFTGTYSQASGFSIKLGASTMAACPEGSLDQQYLQLLGAVAAGGPDGQGNLALETAGGEQRMLFVNGGAAPAP